MNRALFIAVLTCFAVACDEAVDDTDSDTGMDTEADTDGDTEADTDPDTDDDTGMMASCNDPIVGGAVGGDLLDDGGDVAAQVRVTDRCNLLARGLTYDFSGTVYPAIQVYIGDTIIGDLWVNPQAYDNEDFMVPLALDGDGNPMWDGSEVLTVNLADAISPDDVWATVELERVE